MTIARGASPEIEPDEDIEDDSQAPGNDRDLHLTDADADEIRLPSSDAEPLESREFWRRPPALIGSERSPLLFDEVAESSSQNHGQQPFAFNDNPAENLNEIPFEQTECEPYRFWTDVKSVPSILWADGKSLFTWQNAIVLGAAAGGALWIRDDFDGRVRQETAEHPSRWGEGSEVLRQFGEYTYQVPVLAGVYAASLWTQDDRLHEFSLTTLSAYGLNAVTTLSIKGIANTNRPTTVYENGHYGFPSYHASSTFTIAACIEEFYGWEFGLPAYALASLVAWSRVDQREHDLSDVLFGAVLGVVIGKTVSAAHLDRQADLKISPYYDMRNQATGVQVEKRF